eukprot:TRINITY_DN5829_c0_g1_i2.p1 TRINITY_DN5829_c0_g1~~TRINITY_DN5829_c0_g1_i2.p1  ORF type:complete len:333 (-),score=60.50 TRINITY_DN5829_c0_g1_i2:71-1069(-)
MCIRDRNSLELLMTHSLKFMLIPLISNCLLRVKLNRADQIDLQVAIKLVEYLNKNDEWVLSKLLIHYAFNPNAAPAFAAIKSELIVLYEFFRGYTEGNLKVSKSIWKQLSNSRDQPESDSFLPLRELWILNPALYIDSKGPPPNSLAYYTALLRYLNHLSYTSYEKFCILSIVLTNYSEFVGNPSLYFAGKELALRVLNNEKLVVAYSSGRIEALKPFSLENIADRLATSYAEISYNNPLLAMLTFALMQSGLDESVQAKVLGSVKPLIGRMAVNFEKEILGKEEWYVKDSIGNDMMELYEWAEKELQKAKIPKTNKMHSVIAINIAKHLKD